MSYEVEVGRFLNLPLKKTIDVDLVKPMEAFIKNNNLNKSDEDLMRSVREFDAIRKNATAKALDKHDSSLKVLYQYYDQLSSLNKKMPFCEGVGVNVLFTWKGSLDKKKLTSGTPKLSIANGNFELLCVLYNIAALMTQIGSNSNLKTDDGLKVGAKYFMESAGVFNYVKDHISRVVGNLAVTSDLNPTTLHSFSAIMVAQAQECFYMKAAAMKAKLQAKLAAQVATYYKDAAAAIGSGERISSLNQALEQCQLKRIYYECRAEYHEAKALVDGGSYGEAVARLKRIEPPMKILMKSQSKNLVGTDLNAFNTLYNAELKQIEKDNSFIYLDMVPKPDTLSPISGAVVAKAKVFDETEKLSAKFNDMFTALVPLSVHNALEVHDGKKKELVGRQIDRLRESNNLLNGVMSSLNLPAALEDVNSSGGDLPASILEKSRTVCSKGGVETIDQLLKDLPDALERNRQILNESVRVLDLEQTTDTELRQNFGDKWTRKPSSELTAPLRQEAAKYQNIIENAKKADAIVREKYHTNREGIEILGLPEPELKKKIPAAGSLASLKGNPVIVELKMLCEKVETIKAEREVIENELRETKFDMTDIFVQALTSDGAIDESPLSVQHLDRVYQPLIQQVNESTDSQKNLLANIQRASEQFSVLKQQTAGGNQREEMLKKLAAAYDGFQELSSHLTEGGKFYNDLTGLLLKLQTKCSDLVFARKTEKEYLMRDLQQGIIGNASEVADPQVPAHIQEARSVPPARPPPPASAPSAISLPSAPVPAPRRNVTTPGASAPPPPQATSVSLPAHMQAPYGAPPATTQAVGPPQIPAHQQAPYAGYPAAQAGAAPAPYSNYPMQTPYPPQPYGYPPQGGYQPQPQQYGGYPQQQQQQQGGQYYPGYPQQQPGYPGQPGQPQQQPGYPGQTQPQQYAAYPQQPGQQQPPPNYQG